MGCIAVGVDRSDTARRAAGRSTSPASDLAHDLHLALCFERSRGVLTNVGGETFDSDWPSSAQGYLREVGLHLPHQSVTSSAVDDDPASAIVEEANRRDAGIAAVRNRLTQVLSSVAGDVMSRADCDVDVADTTAGADDG